MSIIIPTYNSEKTLMACLQSIKDQPYPYYEIIIVDGFSNDHTLEIAKKLGANVIQQKCNPATARNMGIANSTGKYLLFLDSDQTLSRSLVKECVTKCTNEKAGMARIPEIFVGKGFWSSCSATWKNYYEEIEQKYGTRINLFHGEPRFFVKELILRAGMFDTALLWGEDYDLYEKLKKMNVKETLCKSEIYHYENESLRKLLLKNLRYGRSMPVFLHQTKKRIFPSMFRHALLTLIEILKNSKSPAMICGCAFLLYLRGCSMLIGLQLGFLSSISKI